MYKLYPFARPLFFALDAETAHDLAFAGLDRAARTGIARALAPHLPDAPVEAMGITFPNRIGLAAGLDKNAAHVDGLATFGFGFLEVGTVTPRPQPGNPKPRMFRLPKAHALINRLGFNNEGLESFLANVRRARFRGTGGMLGLNIGKNAATPIEQAADDYRIGLTGVYPHADYVTVNISSPNTQNLRSLQSDAALDALLADLQDTRERLAQAHQRRVPIFLKIAPDLDEAQVEVIAATCRRHGIDGVIATNTTLSREAVKGLPHAQETGGLSGAPVREASNRVIAWLRRSLGEGFPIIGVGGVMSAEDARAKRAAGADLVQIYTGLIYRGPELVGEVARALSQR